MPSSHLRAIRSIDGSVVNASISSIFTHRNACDSSLTRNASAPMASQRVPRIEVMVRRVVQPRRNQVNVDVEEQIAHGFDDQTRLLERFPARDPERIAVAVAVSAELQPAIQFAMVREEHVRLRSIDDPCRAGDVSGPAISFEAAWFVADECLESSDGFRLRRAALPILA